MTRLVLMTTLLLGTSIVAQAWPYHPSDPDRQIDRDRDRSRHDRGDWQDNDRGYQGRRVEGRYERTRGLHDRYVEGQWNLLSSDSAPNGRQTIGLGRDPNAFYTRLRIQAIQGRPLIRRIDVVYRDGTHQVIEPRRVLDARTGNTSFDIDLDPNRRQIRMIGITSEPSRWARYEVLGYP
ncbi:MAG: hypothetical protein JWO36_6676 [Myxococcales bacterium]|nr:hypothetical protein [Myxococcales bacterium]